MKYRYLLYTTFALFSSFNVAAQIPRAVDNKGTMTPLNWGFIAPGNTTDIYNLQMGKVGIGIKTPFATFHNAGSTILGSVAFTDFAVNTTLTQSTVDSYSGVVVTQTTPNISLTLPLPSSTTTGRQFQVANASASTTPFIINGISVAAGSSAFFRWDGSAWSSLTALANNVPLSGLTAATATNSINNGDFAQTWNWNSSTTVNPLTLSSSSLTNGDLFSLVTTNSSHKGSLLSIRSNASSPSNGIVSLNFDANHTGAGLNIQDQSSTGIAVQIDPRITTGIGVRLITDNLTSGQALLLSSSSPNMTSSGRIMTVASGGANTGLTTSAEIKNVHTGTGSVNVGLSVSSGGGDKNYAIIVPPGGGSVGIGTSTPVATFHNAGSTVLGLTTLANQSSNVTLTASSTVDAYSGVVVTQTTPNISLDLPLPSSTTAGRQFQVANALASTTPFTINGISVAAGSSAFFRWDGSSWSSLTALANNVPLSGLTSATATNSINNGDFAQTWNWNSSTTNNPLTLATSSLTSGNLFSLSNSNASHVGRVLDVTSNSTTPSSDGIVKFNFTGDHTNAGFRVSDITTAGTAVQLKTDFVSTGTALDISTSSSALNSAKGLLSVANTGSTTSGILFRAQSNATAGSGLTVLTNGNTGIGTASPIASFHNAGSTVLGFNSGTVTGSTFTILSATVNSYSGIVLTNTFGDCSVTLQAPSTTASVAGRIFTVSNIGTSTYPVTVGKYTILPGHSETFVWDGNGLANGKWTTRSTAALTVPLSGLTAATATNSINNGDFAQTWNWNSSTSTNPLTIASTSLTTGSLFNVVNTNVSHTSQTFKVVSNATAPVGGIARFEFTGDHTGGGLMVSDKSTTDKAVSIYSAATSGIGLYISPDKLTSGSGLQMLSNSPTLNGSKLMWLQTSGSLSSVSNATNYVAYINNNNGGGTNNTNVGLYASADGTAANNYAIVVPSGGGNVGIGTETPVATLHNAGSTVLGLNTVNNSLSTWSPANTATVDKYSGVVVTQSVTPCVITLPSPSSTATAGRTYTVANSNSSGYALMIGSSIIQPGQSATYVWDGVAWIVPAITSTSFAMTAISANYSLSVLDYTVLLSKTASTDVTVTLPASPTNGKTYRFVNLSASNTMNFSQPIRSANGFTTTTLSSAVTNVNGRVIGNKMTIQWDAVDNEWVEVGN